LPASSPKRSLDLRLLRPVRPPRVSSGESVYIEARVLCRGLEACSIRLEFDRARFAEDTGTPTTQDVPVATGNALFNWTLRVIPGAKASSSVRVVAEGDGLLQVSEFNVEVN